LPLFHNALSARTCGSGRVAHRIDPSARAASNARRRCTRVTECVAARVLTCEGAPSADRARMHARDHARGPAAEQVWAALQRPRSYGRQQRATDDARGADRREAHVFQLLQQLRVDLHAKPQAKERRTSSLRVAMRIPCHRAARNICVRVLGMTASASARPRRDHRFEACSFVCSCVCLLRTGGRTISPVAASAEPARHRFKDRATSRRTRAESAVPAHPQAGGWMWHWTGSDRVVVCTCKWAPGGAHAPPGVTRGWGRHPSCPCPLARRLSGRLASSSPPQPTWALFPSAHWPRGPAPPAPPTALMWSSERQVAAHERHQKQGQLLAKRCWATALRPLRRRRRSYRNPPAHRRSR
jgi:hypothetical protein